MLSVNPTDRHGSVDAAIRALSSHGALLLEEMDFARSAIRDVQQHPVGARAIGKPGRDARRIVLSGWIGASVQLLDGRRQIVRLALPGDLLEDIDLVDFELSYVALTRAETGDATDLIKEAERLDSPYANLAASFARMGRAARAREVSHLLRLGRFSAYERTANLFTELQQRLQRAGLADAGGIPMPLTQEMLSDLLGLSVVHVNRILQQLRRNGLIAYRGGRVTFSDGEALAAVAGLGSDRRQAET